MSAKPLKIADGDRVTNIVKTLAKRDGGTASTKRTQTASPRSGPGGAKPDCRACRRQDKSGQAAGEFAPHHGRGLLPIPVSRTLLAIAARFRFIEELDAKPSARLSEEPCAGAVAIAKRSIYPSRIDKRRQTARSAARRESASESKPHAGICEGGAR